MHATGVQYVHTYMFNKYCSVLSPPPLPQIPPFIFNLFTGLLMGTILR